MPNTNSGNISFNFNNDYYKIKDNVVSGAEISVYNNSYIDQDVRKDADVKHNTININSEEKEIIGEGLISISGNNVIGVLTNFTSIASVGDKLKVGSLSTNITSIISDTYLTISKTVFTGNGTISAIKNSKIVNGVGTTFLTEANVGEKIYVNGIEKTITSITSNTILNVNSNYTVAFNNQTYKIQPNINNMQYSIYKIGINVNNNNSAINIYDNNISLNSASNDLNIYNNSLSGNLNLESENGVILSKTIRTTAVPGGTPVHVITDGTIGYKASSVKYKTNIYNMREKEEFAPIEYPNHNLLLTLNSKFFKYNSDLMNNSPEANIENVGMIAEELDNLGFKHLVFYKDEEPEGIRYDLISVYLLEIIKDLNNRVIELETKING